METTQTDWIDVTYLVHFLSCHGNVSNMFAGRRPGQIGGGASGGRETEAVSEALRKPQILLESGSSEGDPVLHHQVEREQPASVLWL